SQSSIVNSSPLCHLTPFSIVNVYSLLSSVSQSAIYGIYSKCSLVVINESCMKLWISLSIALDVKPGTYSPSGALSTAYVNVPPLASSSFPSFFSVELLSLLFSFDGSFAELSLSLPHAANTNINDNANVTKSNSL